MLLETTKNIHRVSQKREPPIVFFRRKQPVGVN